MTDPEIALYVKAQLDELKQHVEDRIAESLEKFKEEELSDFQNEDQVTELIDKLKSELGDGLRDISTSIEELAGTSN